MCSKKISIIIPVYNVAGYLSVCLDSILSQSHSNLEIICVDDGSTDASPELLRIYASKHESIRVVTKPNGGLSSARNEGLRHATGEYVCFLDSDDWYARDFLSKAESVASSTLADLVLMNAQVYDETQNLYYDFYDTHRLLALLGADDRRRLSGCLHDKYFFLEPNTSRRMFSMAFIKRIELVYPEGFIYEDVPVHFLCGMMTDDIVVVNAVGYFYRVGRPNKITEDNGVRRLDVISMHRDALNHLKAKHAGEAILIAWLHSLVRMGWWCYSRVDTSLKRRLRSGLSELLEEIDSSIIDAYLKSEFSSHGEKLRLIAIESNVPLSFLIKLESHFGIDRSRRFSRPLSPLVNFF